LTFFILDIDKMLINNIYKLILKSMDSSEGIKNPGWLKLIKLGAERCLFCNKLLEKPGKYCQYCGEKIK